MRFFYTLSVELYVLAVRIASLWNAKAKDWVSGRRDVWQKLDAFDRKEGELHWFHCASLGEFEQARPLIEELKKDDCQIVVTFFSPSGYNIRKDYELADLVIYLPKDSKKNARRLLEKLQPTKAFFIKYEFWANYIFELKRREIPVYLVSAVFRPKHIFFKWYGGYMRSVLEQFDEVFTQDVRSSDLLSSIDVESVLTGDTRYDRVLSNAAKVKSYPEIEKFVGDKKVLICGSVWQDDMQLIKNKINKLNEDWKVIIAPHEIHDSNVQKIQSQLRNSSCRYSKGIDDSQILIIDNIGMLMHLYQYGQVAYVGGAFHGALHNILEPAAFGLPVIYGPILKKFPESQLFADKNVGIPVLDEVAFSGAVDILSDKDFSESVMQFMNAQAGATGRILHVIREQA